MGRFSLKAFFKKPVVICYIKNNKIDRCCDCGWDLQLRELLLRLREAEKNERLVRVESVDGFISELDLLCEHLEKSGA